MIHTVEAVKLLANTVPVYKAALDHMLADWYPDEPGICLLFAEFSHITVRLFQESQLALIRPVFDVIEQLLMEGDEVVKDATATCFLEPILNRVPERIPAETLRTVLGCQAQEYGRAWNAFTGVDIDLPELS